ncbi:hypothetical protein BDD12DRAFT_873428 [Trichophaea hybrida]|nr:hypothetical protein BDD12DRAFT_873428 [Trichophaea hybrida]
MQPLRNHHDLCQQTLNAIAFLDANSAFSGSSQESSIVFRRRLAPQSETALTWAQIAEIETADIRRRYAGIQALRANRKQLTKALAEEKKAQIQVVRAKVKTRKSQEEFSGKETTRAKASKKQKAKVLKKVTIILSNEEGEKARGLSDLEKPDWYPDNNVMPF